MSELRNELPDFDRLVELASTDPDGLENLRHSLIEDFIERAPQSQRRRLKGLQFVIDMERRRAKNPVQSCIRMSQLMYDRVNDLRDTLSDFGLPSPNFVPPSKAQVIPLFANKWEDEEDNT